MDHTGPRAPQKPAPQATKGKTPRAGRPSRQGQTVSILDHSQPHWLIPTVRM